MVRTKNEEPLTTKPLIGGKDTLAAGLCMVLLLALLGAVGTGGRERAKRIVCMMNVRHLTGAWLNYANDNDDRLVNAQAGGDLPGQKAWVGRCWADPYNMPCPPAVRWPISQQIQSIKSGALWGHTGETRLYACPDGVFGEMVTSAIMDGVNGMPRAGTSTTWPNVGPDGSLLQVTKWTQIARPAVRLVFIDQGYATPSSFAVYWDSSSHGWWDGPPTRHNGGTVVSFADGHVTYHKWKGRVTVLYGNQYADYRGPGLRSGDVFGAWGPEEWEDLHFVHNGCWGQTHPSFPWQPGGSQPDGR